MSYATLANMVQRYDYRRLADLVRDDDTRATLANLTNPAVVDGQTLQAALDDFAGEIDTGCLLGGRYTTADLIGLVASFTQGGPTTPGGTPTDPAYHSGALLIRMNCDGAYGLLLERRGFNQAELASMAPLYIRALLLVDKLRWGERIFAIPSVLGVSEPINDTLSTQLILISSNTRIFGDISNGVGLYGTNTPAGSNLPQVPTGH